jgi:AcrR family transcriptional regulator
MVTTHRRAKAAEEAERERAAGRARRRLPPGERRALIEQAAARLFAEQGYETTTVEHICAAAGVSKPMLYRHFESKTDLCRRLIERRRDELAAAPLGTFLEADGPLEQRLEAMIDAWFAHVAEHPNSSRVLFQDITGDAELRELQRELRRRQRAADMAMLREFGPPLPEAELEPLGEVIRSSLTGLALWWLEHADVPRASVVSVMLRMMKGVLATA